MDAQLDRVLDATHADNTASQNAARNAGFRYLPGRDEVRMVGNQEWPARWYSLIFDRHGPEQPPDAHLIL